MPGMTSQCGDVKMWRCEDVEMWRCGDVEMWRCGDVKMWLPHFHIFTSAAGAPA
jgi:predicted RNA-binding Zn-ribbon protein involved in translation (DUF1610 family)